MKLLFLTNWFFIISICFLVEAKHRTRKLSTSIAFRVCLSLSDNDHSWSARRQELATVFCSRNILANAGQRFFAYTLQLLHKDTTTACVVGLRYREWPSWFIHFPCRNSNFLGSFLPPKEKNKLTYSKIDEHSTRYYYSFECTNIRISFTSCFSYSSDCPGLIV